MIFCSIICSSSDIENDRIGAICGQSPIPNKITLNNPVETRSNQNSGVVYQQSFRMVSSP